MKSVICILLLVVMVPAMVMAADLTGAWGCDDGGSYYLRQLGSELWWYGEQSSNNPAWSNIAHGTIMGNRIELKWTDVPKGHIMNSGMLQLELQPDGRIVARNKTGGFGGSAWTRR